MGKVVSSSLVALLCQGVVLNPLNFKHSPATIYEVTFYSKLFCLLGDGFIGKKAVIPPLPSIYPYQNIRYYNIYMEWT